MMSFDMRSRNARVWLLVSGCTIGIVIGIDRSVTARTVAADTGRVAAIGVGPVTAAEFEARGLYIGPPGQVPSAAAGSRRSNPPQTAPVGSAPYETATTVLSGEQQAVMGDPASGSASISGTRALAVAKADLAGFVGTPTFGAAVLVQYDNAPAGVVATAWAIPVAGQVQLSYGAAPTSTTPGQTIQGRPPVNEVAVVFIDAVTGKLISEDGFAGRP